jgi:hypothetical protein
VRPPWRRKRAIGTRAPMLVPMAPNDRLSLDFVSDHLAGAGSRCPSMLARRLQRLTPAFSARMEDTLRVCLHFPSAKGAGAALYRGLRAIPLTNRANATARRTQNWIKLGGNVTREARTITLDSLTGRQVGIDEGFSFLFIRKLLRLTTPFFSGEHAQ